MNEKERNFRNECWDCIHRRAVPGNAHIMCVKPDPNMVGRLYGIENGWFDYPWLFDPVWKEVECKNFKLKEK